MLALGSHCPNSNRRLFCLPKLFELYRQTPEGIMRLASSRWLADGNDTIIITNSFYLQLGVLPRIFSWICKRYRDGFMREFAFINNCFVGNFVKLFRSAAVNIVLILQRKSTTLEVIFSAFLSSLVFVGFLFIAWSHCHCPQSFFWLQTPDKIHRDVRGKRQRDGKPSIVPGVHWQWER